MGDRWMDEQDRQRRERDWRRSQMSDADYGRDAESRRGREPRTFSGEDEASGRYEAEDRHHGSNEQAYGRSSNLTTGESYFEDPTGARSRYGVGRQDYTRGAYGQGGPRRAYGGGPAYGADWDSDRDEGWSRFSAERARPYERREREREDWRDRREGAGDFLSRAGERITSWFRGSDLMREDRQEADDGRPRRYREDFGREARAIPEGGGHRGRGPRGYRRPDERIEDEAHDRLTDDPWLDASNIEVEVKNGEVTLNGSVDNREAKHRAERLIEDISGVGHVQNNLRVNPDLTLTGAGRGLGSSVLEAEMRRNAQTTEGDQARRADEPPKSRA